MDSETEFGLFRLLVCLTAALSIPSIGLAQLAGLIRDDHGTPLKGVLVELWTPTRRTAALVTDSTGQFRFSSIETGEATGLLARALGYRPVRLRLSGADTLVSLRMEGLPVAMSEVRVEARASTCPTNEQRRARELMLAVQRRYSPRYESVALGALVKYFQGVVPADRLGVVDTTGLVWGQRGSIGAVRAEWRRWIALHGYARPQSGLNMSGLFDEWEYPPLESDYAQHFIDSVFFRRHRFFFGDSQSGQYVLEFCSKDTRFPSISGDIIIASDSTLVSVQWAFHTPRATESAGGQVAFAPIDTSPMSTMLLPVSGLFWRRRAAGGGYVELWQEYRDWIINWTKDSLIVPRVPQSWTPGTHED